MNCWRRLVFSGREALTFAETSTDSVSLAATAPGKRLTANRSGRKIGESTKCSQRRGREVVGMAPSESDPVGAAVIGGAAVVFRSNKGWADKAVAQLPDEKLHVALDPNTNCVAVIMKHVAGNLRSRWTEFLTSDGEKPWRDRDNEFVDSFASRSDLLAFWEQGWNCLFETLASLTPSDLARTVTIRGEPHSVPLAIHRSLAHCGYHVGQIVMIARILAGDQWQTITIPRGKSAAFNQAVWGQGSFQRNTENPPAKK